MMRTKILTLLPRAAGVVRHLSSATKLTTVEVNDKTGIATLTMNRPPVNGLNLELLTSINQSIQEIEGNKSRGLILTSVRSINVCHVLFNSIWSLLQSNPTIFSAGLDILEMYKPDKERIRAFWTALQDTWLALYGSSVPTAAAINVGPHRSMYIPYINIDYHTGSFPCRRLLAGRIMRVSCNAAEIHNRAEWN